MQQGYASGPQPYFTSASLLQGESRQGQFVCMIADLESTSCTKCDLREITPRYAAFPDKIAASLIQERLRTNSSFPSITGLVDSTSSIDSESIERENGVV